MVPLEIWIDVLKGVNHNPIMVDWLSQNVSQLITIHIVLLKALMLFVLTSLNWEHCVVGIIEKYCLARVGKYNQYNYKYKFSSTIKANVGSNLCMQSFQWLLIHSHQLLALATVLGRFSGKPLTSKFPTDGYYKVKEL